MNRGDAKGVIKGAGEVRPKSWGRRKKIKLSRKKKKKEKNCSRSQKRALSAWKN